jgi:hypothetical protein
MVQLLFWDKLWSGVKVQMMAETGWVPGQASVYETIILWEITEE